MTRLPVIALEEFDSFWFPKHFLKNGEIRIEENHWKKLNRFLSKKTIKELISRLILEHGVPLPYREILLEDAILDFERLRNMDCIPLIQKGEYFTRYDYGFPMHPKYIAINNVGNRSSDFFHQKNRWRCDSINSPSPYRSWTIKKFQMSLLNALWTLKFKSINKKVFRSAIGLRKYIAAQFRPSAAKAVYQHFDAKKVLDFSTGWGDRLTAFMATSSTVSYFGCDPNENLFADYERQKKIFGHGKKIEIINAPAEEVDFPKRAFDVVFTSPPYFIIERYTQEDNQSWQRYKKVEDWLSKFLFPVFHKACCSLKMGGVIVINLSDVYCNHTINRLCDPLFEYASTIRGMKYISTWGLRLAKRPMSKADKGGVFAEPLMIWRKKGRMTP